MHRFLIGITGSPRSLDNDELDKLRVETIPITDDECGMPSPPEPHSDPPDFDSSEPSVSGSGSSSEPISSQLGSLSQWKLGQVLGVGTVGTIYRALNGDNGQIAAIKKLHPRVSSDQLVRARFKREMTVLQRLSHPNIVAYLGGNPYGEAPFYAMEIVDGGTVKELLEDGPLPWPAVADITRQLCSALQCAHNHGIVHRDLKPGNLFLTRDGLLKLGDFGIARDLTRNDLTAKGFTVGTHAYMSPEQITGDSSVSGSSDLYALGCCMFEMLTNRQPFFGDSYPQLFDQHLKAKPPRASEMITNLPSDLDAIIYQLMEKDPLDRPFNARQVQAVMLQLLDQNPAADPPLTACENTEATRSGSEILVQRIQSSGRPQAHAQPEISARKLALVFAFIVIAALIAAKFAG